MDASDLHLEPGLPAVFRIRGELKTLGKSVDADTLLTTSRRLVGDKNWPFFVDRCSFDLSANIQGVRCRINVMKTNRGVGLAIRLLSSFQPTLEKLNLHPDLKDIAHRPHGLVLISGPTGSGKSSTLAALIQEINLSQSKHIITIENPIEYHFKALKSFIRQREVGRDTPSFSQGLMDALREDPDVILVGELRDLETIEAALTIAETGYSVSSSGASPSPPNISHVAHGSPSARPAWPESSITPTPPASIAESSNSAMPAGLVNTVPASLARAAIPAPPYLFSPADRCSLGYCG